MPTAISSHVSIKPAANLSGRSKNLLLAIDSIHSDGNLGDIRTFGSPRPVDQCGYYNPAKNLIRLSTARNDHELTITHELGHVVAIRGLGLGKPICGSSVSLAAWRSAIKSSPEFRALEKMKKTGERRVSVLGVVRTIALDPAETEHLAYLLFWEELWARSYSQFIALSGGNENLLAQFSAETASFEGRFYYMYWRDANFGPIGKAIADVFIAKGWM